jgi:hypothetical protein
MYNVFNWGCRAGFALGLGVMLATQSFTTHPYRTVCGLTLMATSFVIWFTKAPSRKNAVGKRKDAAGKR